MASVAKHIVLLFFIVLSSSVRIQAREGKFYSKIINLGAKISALVEPTPSPAVAPVLAPATAPANIEGVTTSNTPTTTSTFENDLFAEEFADEKYDSGYEKSSYNNNGYTNSNYNDNGYKLSKYNNNGYETERQGMSDTRFVEGGKYYHDVKNDNYYPTGYEYSSSYEASKNGGYYGIQRTQTSSTRWKSLRTRRGKKSLCPRQGRG
ncbi:hypothetical protein F3Y22_tig00003041pilonHSYRG01400 [Hibiscus syriacus]|uniref:Protein E6-like n=1 Tax=Hibiscus syriacus TaxID=106335 RepID=A0A6A3CS55_HIBSY|nr:hypothetical protein F3Y22_tig00003041pilonHSYRG01400 [Hibiscus syriacus]